MSSASEKKRTVKINFGLPLGKQLIAQGFAPKAHDVKVWQHQTTMITGLYLVGLLTEVERNAAYNRLLAKIKSIILQPKQHE